MRLLLQREAVLRLLPLLLQKIAVMGFLFQQKGAVLSLVLHLLV